MTLIRPNFRTNQKLHAPPNPHDKTQTLSFHVDPSVSKPEIKAYIENLYGLKVKKVATMIRMGRFARDEETYSWLTRTLQKA